jgi:hypothetical protein
MLQRTGLSGWVLISSKEGGINRFTPPLGMIYGHVSLSVGVAHACSDTAFPQDVAEENIKPINPTKEIIMELFESNECMDAVFEGADLREDGNGGPGRGRLLLSPDSRNRYPGDDHVGAEWVEGRVEL